MPTVNRAVEQLKRGQPIYYGGAGELSYEKGIEASGRWEDYLVVEMEHGLFDLPSLKAFMAGLVDGGPAPTGHLTPCIIVTLPTNGTSEAVMRANAWMVKQLLALGVHGLLLCHAETPGAVRAFVEAARYPFQTRGVGAASKWASAARAARASPRAPGDSPCRNTYSGPTSGL